MTKVETDAQEGEEEEVEIKREKWNNRMEFSLAALGYCIGMGAMTRFPYLVMISFAISF